MEKISKLQRSYNMSRIPSRDTSPELKVRKVLSKLGCKYRLHVGKLAGKPDIVIGRYKTVIFVNGCFWHQHAKCKRCTIPKTHQDYWLEKLRRNVQKQKQDIKKLKQEDWQVDIIWECETKRPGILFERIQKIIDLGR